MFSLPYTVCLSYLSQVVIVQLRVGLGHDAVVFLAFPLNCVCDHLAVDVDHALLKRRLVHVNLHHQTETVIVLKLS